MNIQPLALTHTVRRWRHCWTAHAWWHGLVSPRQLQILWILHR